MMPDLTPDQQKTPLKTLSRASRHASILKLIAAAVVFLGGATVLNLVFSQLLLPASLLIALPSFWLLLALLTPFRRQVIGGASAVVRNRFWPWLGQIVLMQLLVMLIWLALAVSLLGPLGLSANPDLPVEPLIGLTLFGAFYVQGFQPWGLMLFIAVFVGTVGVHHRAEKISGLYYPMSKQQADALLGSIVDFAACLLIFVGLFLFTSLAIYQLAYLLAQLFAWPVTTYPLMGMGLLGAAMFMVFAAKPAVSLIDRISETSQHLDRFFAVILLFGCALYLFFNGLFHWLGGRFFPELLEPFSLIANPAIDLGQAWYLLSWSILIGLSLLGGLWLARASVGRTVSQCIAATVVLPAILLVLFQFGVLADNGPLTESFIGFASGVLFIVNSPLYGPLLTVSVFVLLLVVLRRSVLLNQCLLAMTPNRPGKKVYRLRRALVQSSATVVTLLIIFLLMGMPGLSLLMSISATVLFVLLLVSLPFLLKIIFFSKKNLT